MSGDDVRVEAADVAATSSGDLCDKVAEMAKYSDQFNGAMTAVLCAQMQTGQI
jgi:hypothetical protein